MAVTDPIELVSSLMRENERLKKIIASHSQGETISQETANTLKNLPAANDDISQSIRTLLQDEQFITCMVNTDQFMFKVQSLGLLEALPTWVIGRKYARITGFEQPALNAKRRTHCLKDKHWTVAADGNVYYNWRQIDDWVENSVPPRKN